MVTNIIKIATLECLNAAILSYYFRLTILFGPFYGNSMKCAYMILLLQIFIIYGWSNLRRESIQTILNDVFSMEN